MWAVWALGMRMITSFPATYPLIRRHVRAIILLHALTASEETTDQIQQHGDIDYRNADFFVELKHGEVYSFFACTPEYAKYYMEREGERAFISPGLFLVRDVLVASVLAAVEACIEDGMLEQLGVLQSEEGTIADAGAVLTIAR